MEISSPSDPRWDGEDEMELVILKLDDEEDEPIPMTSCCTYTYLSWYIP